MSLIDDVPPGPRPRPITGGRVTAKPFGPTSVPVGQSNQTVMVMLTGNEPPNERFSLDLVAVLDVSGSMADKLDKMKAAMVFIIKKLGPSDRLSIVSFSDNADKLCALRLVTEAREPELLGIVAGLKANGQTNIQEGLSTGLKVLADRTGNIADRVIGVMLMSDGQENVGAAAQVAIGNVPVYTFGFGAKFDCKLLNAVARNSMGGTFNYVNDIGDGLMKAFSQSVALLLTIVAQNLELTVNREEGESTIKKVTSGIYRRNPDATDANTKSVTVSFGNLSTKEVRTVTVDLNLLPGEESDVDARILTYDMSYTVGGRLNKDNQGSVIVTRTGTVGAEDDQPQAEVQMEKARVEAVRIVKTARDMADDQKMEDARYTVGQAQNVLFNVVDQNSSLMRMLLDELAQLMKLMETQAVYEKEGRSYALSSETSHDLQRFAVRGEIESQRLFATPRMDKYLEQAKSFEENPKIQLPSVDEDVKEELAANPLAPFSGPITIYIQNAIQALQAIERLINNGGKA